MLSYYSLNHDTSHDGSNPQIENPVMAFEPHPYFNRTLNATVTHNLYLSVGTYNEANSYHTYEVDCAGYSGPCDAQHPTLINVNLRGPNNVQQIQNTGGFAFLEGSALSFERFSVFHASSSTQPVSSSTVRNLYYQTTDRGPAPITEPKLDSNQSLTLGQCLCNATTGWGLDDAGGKSAGSPDGG